MTEVQICLRDGTMFAFRGEDFDLQSDKYISGYLTIVEKNQGKVLVFPHDQVKYVHVVGKEEELIG